MSPTKSSNQFSWTPGNFFNSELANGLSIDNKLSLIETPLCRIETQHLQQQPPSSPHLLLAREQQVHLVDEDEGDAVLGASAPPAAQKELLQRRTRALRPQVLPRHCLRPDRQYFHRTQLCKRGR